MSKCVIISGCSGGGKSTLIAALAKCGHATVLEPGRRVIREELQDGGTALPWSDAAAFLWRVMAMAQADLKSKAASPDWVFFDRSMIDAAVGIEHMTGAPVPLGPTEQYHRAVFMAPPWPEIYVTDAERRHGLEVAEAEYARLLAAYPARGYDVIILPKIGIVERAAFIGRHLQAQVTRS